MSTSTGAPLNLRWFSEREKGYQKEFQQDMETINAFAQGITDGSIPVPVPPVPITPPSVYTGPGGVVDLTSNDTWFVEPAGPITITGLTEPTADVINGRRLRLYFTTPGNVSMNHNDGGAPAAQRVFFNNPKNMLQIGDPLLVPVEWLDLVYITGQGWAQIGGSFGMGRVRTVVGANTVPGWPAPITANVRVLVSVAPLFIPRTATAAKINVFNLKNGGGNQALQTTLFRPGVPGFYSIANIDRGGGGVANAGETSAMPLDENGSFDVQNSMNAGTGTSIGFLVGWLD